MRRTRKTLYVVTSLYVFLGLVILVSAAIVGDPVSSFVGFLIVGGALAAAVVLVNLFRVSERIERLREEVRKLSEVVGDRAPGDALAPSAELAGDEDHSVAQVDLAALGGGEISALTAATLDRDRFPRLVVSMQEDEMSSMTRDRTSPGELAECAEPVEALWTLGVASRNLLRGWKVAQRARDLNTCRRIYSALVDLGEIRLVESLKMELAQLAVSTERNFRARFSELVNSRRYDDALTVGDEMAAMFSGQPIEAQFLALRPMLLRASARIGSPPRVAQNI